MTNGDRIRNMSNKELAEELSKFGDCDFKNHIDLEAWLNAEEKDYIIPGDKALVKMNDGKTYGGTIVGERNMMGQEYYKLVMDEDFPFASRVMSAPKKSIIKDSKDS